ncbi:hypothetical protein J3R83DRAFT_4713 [Lanmaoa asiatica]|nr:hypothetical protein J3R83DRAFT_4713 [Lanmaoa asiatica]
MSSDTMWPVGYETRTDLVWRRRGFGVCMPPEEDQNLGLSERDKKKKRSYKVTFERAFERQRFLDKAKAAFAVHASYVDGERFFFGDRYNCFDSYPGLVEHARRIQAEVALVPPYEHLTASKSLLSSLVPRPFNGNGTQTQVNPADIQYRRKTLLFTIAALAMAAVSIYMHVFIDGLAKDSEDESDSEDGEDEGSGNEEEEGGEGDLASES